MRARCTRLPNCGRYNRVRALRSIPVLNIHKKCHSEWYTQYFIDENLASVTLRVFLQLT